MSGGVRAVAGLAEIVDRYDAFIIDLWGVLHDGAAPYPGAVDALERLHEAGKPVALLSNAPRPSEIAVTRLDQLGFSRTLYRGLTTSGDHARRALRRRADDPALSTVGDRLYFLGPPKDEAMLDDIPYRRVHSLAEADLILCTGVDFGLDLAACSQELTEGVARDLPMICANPDLSVMHMGRREICAGAIAEEYERRGGVVRRHGKPRPEIYQDCFAMLDGTPPARVLAIGDGLKTDVAGANAVGIDSLFIAQGVHAEELGITPGDTPDSQRLASLAMHLRVAPTYSCARFAW